MKSEIQKSIFLRLAPVLEPEGDNNGAMGTFWRYVVGSYFCAELCKAVRRFHIIELRNSHRRIGTREVALVAIVATWSLTIAFQFAS